MATSFDALETSGNSGHPIYLVEFARPGRTWRMANVDQPVVNFEGQPYTGMSLTFTSFVQTGDAKAENLDITVPATCDLAKYLDLITPTEAISVKIRKAHVTENPADGSWNVNPDAAVVWVGEYIALSRPSVNSRRLTCNTLSLSLNRGGLRLTWARTCPHALYGPDCKADKSKFAYPLTNVAVLDNVTIAADQFGAEGIGGTTTKSTVDGCADITSTANWILGPYQTTARGYYSKVFVDSTQGNPPPCFQILAESNLHSPAYAIKDFGADGATSCSMSMDFMIGDSGGSSFASSVMLFGVNRAGNGPRVQCHGTLGGNPILRIGNGIDFDSSGEGSIDVDHPCTGVFKTNHWYTMHATRFGAGTDVTIDLYLYDGATLLGSCTITGTYTTGGYFGPIRAKGDQIERTYVDNFVFASSNTVATGGMSGGLLEWNSEPGILESTGIETEGTGQATILGTTQGMGSGANFVGYLGCDRTAETCHDVFDNLPNFGGCNHMQGRSPFDGQPVF